MEITPLNLFVLLSALWRLCSLVANESGPFDMFGRLRSLAERLSNENPFFRAFHLHEGLCCEWCNSIWFSTVMVVMWLYFGEVVLLVVLPLALSAWVIVMKYAIHYLQNAETYYHRQTVGEGEPAPDPEPAWRVAV